MTPKLWDTDTIAPRVKTMMARWAGNSSSERASLQSFVLELCSALGVAPPIPPAEDYQFEFPVRVVDRDGTETTNFIDCWKAGHFALEGKATGNEIASENAMRKAFGQVITYVAHVSGNAPPYLMVLDVPRHLIVWDRWSGRYGGFAAGRRINLASLHTRPDDIALLCDIFEQPQERDPRARAQAVTKEIAIKLAELAAALENRVGDQERVARFLMRCVFSCFAEDVGLLPSGIFQRTLETGRAAGGAERVARALTALWQTMDSGGMFGAEQLARFNGHFFKTVEALPLETREVDLLIEAARFDWSRVEPSIFGTLLVRAISPEERHRLGAEYTPREYIERLVEPTVVEPIRKIWTAVQAAVLQLDATGKKKDRTAGIGELRKFHDWMRGLSFLDPACGSGNFLYVTMAAVKRIELEVLNELQRLAHGQGGLVLDEVHPRQFHGIEVKPWAREIAELTLWIGYHQFWRETHGGRVPPTPILEDTGTLQCRDALLTWDEIVHRPEMDRPDPRPRIISPITGDLVPDPQATLPYFEYINPRPAAWPRADFIVGNPPYIGSHRMRDSLGDGYVEALRRVYSSVPAKADLVMLWWWRCAQIVSRHEAIRAGLITTNSISQGSHHSVIRKAQEAGATIVWAIPDHPWNVSEDGAAVRVAMTVLAAEHDVLPRLLEVDDTGAIVATRTARRLNDDLTVGSDVATSASVPMLANRDLAFAGFKLHGAGFIVSDREAERLRSHEPDARVVRSYLNGRDLAQRPRAVYVIDFGMLDEAQARLSPMAFQHVYDRVKPERQGNKRESYRKFWWRFGEPRVALREAINGLPRFIVTPETAKHRFFCFVDGAVAPDNKLWVIASADPFVLGVLSSKHHLIWALRAGARLEDRPVYVGPRCFDAFPFPNASRQLHDQIAELAEQLDGHRAAALARDARVTMTGMYNVLEKLRSGDPLTSRERTVHEIAACGVLRDSHDQLDALVAEAYDWPSKSSTEETLERLVALHDERVADESCGRIRWLRPDFQIPRFTSGSAAPEELALTTPTAAPAAARDERRPWPATAVDQLSAVGAAVALAPRTVEEVAATFAGARKDLVSRHLETLAMMGEVAMDEDGRYRAALRAA